MGFDDLDDLNDLDEMPPFEEDLDLPGFDEPGTGGISRTFKILGGLLLLLVVIIVGGLIFWALGDDELTSNQQTSTAVILTNTAVVRDYENTQVAIGMALTATTNYMMTSEFRATQTEIAFQEEQNRQATAAAQTATVEFAASQTADALHAEQTATAEALQATQNAVNRVFGVLKSDDNAPYSGVTLHLYRDNGDGVFTPADIQSPVGEGTEEAEAGEIDVEVDLTLPAPAATAPSTEAQPINFGDQVTGQVEMGVTSQWSFTGTAGDVISIFADADETSVEADMYLSLIGPTGQGLITDDDGGEGTNAAIVNFALPADGQYIIQVSTVSEPGGYILQLTGPSTQADEYADEYVDDYADEYADDYADEYSGEIPTQETAGTGGGGMRIMVHSSQREFLRQDDTPAPGVSDELIQTIITDQLGEFDFGTLEPGIYWLVVEYDTLPDEIKAQLPADELIYIMVEVPLSGEVAFTIGVTPTPTPDFSAADATGTAIMALTQTAMPPVTGTVTVTTPTQLPQTGLFSGSDGSDLDSSSGLTVLAIAAMGLVAVVFIARKLRNSAT